jgi:NADH-quinone oxidoreductase subunit C
MNTVDAAAIVAALTAAVPGAAFQAEPSLDRPTIAVPSEHLLAAAQAVRDRLGFDVLTEVTAVDRWPAEPRFEVIYHLVATSSPALVRFVVRLAGDSPGVRSLNEVYPSADWLEREVWDLFGIVFEEHGDLRRLLMPEDWEGHPLRKDYPVQIRMTPKVYAPLQLTEQEFEANIVHDREVRGGTHRPGD